MFISSVKLCDSRDTDIDFRDFIPCGIIDHAGLRQSEDGLEFLDGSKVRQVQEQLNVIAGAYPALPKIAVDGIYGPATEASAVLMYISSP